MGAAWTHFQEGGWGMWAILVITTAVLYVSFVNFFYVRLPVGIIVGLFR